MDLGTINAMGMPLNVHTLSRRNDATGAAWLHERSVETIASGKHLLGIDGYCAAPTASSTSHLLCTPLIGQTSLADIFEEAAVLVENTALAIAGTMAVAGAIAAAGTTTTIGAAVSALLLIGCTDDHATDDKINTIIHPDGDRDRPEFAPHTDGDEEVAQEEEWEEVDPALCSNGELDPGEECEANSYGVWIGCTDCLLDPSLTKIFSHSMATADYPETTAPNLQAKGDDGIIAVFSVPKIDSVSLYSSVHAFDGRTGENPRLASGYYGIPWRQSAVSDNLELFAYQMGGWEFTTPRVFDRNGDVDYLPISGVETMCTSSDLSWIGGVTLANDPDDTPRAFSVAKISFGRNENDVQIVEGIELAHDGLRDELAGGAVATRHCLDDEGFGVVAARTMDGIGALYLVSPTGASQRIADELTLASAAVISSGGIIAFLAHNGDAKDLVTIDRRDPDTCMRISAPPGVSRIHDISHDGASIITDSGSDESVYIRLAETDEWRLTNTESISEDEQITAAVIRGTWIYLQTKDTTGDLTRTNIWRLAREGETTR